MKGREDQVTIIGGAKPRDVIDAFDSKLAYIRATLRSVEEMLQQIEIDVEQIKNKDRRYDL